MAPNPSVLAAEEEIEEQMEKSAHNVLITVFHNLQKEIHKTARDKGFWDHEILEENIANPTPDSQAAADFGIDVEIKNPSIRGEKIALAMSELGEALEALRDNDEENYAEELADTVIRILDLAEYNNINLGQEILQKMGTNKHRPYKHDRNF